MAFDMRVLVAGFALSALLTWRALQFYCSDPHMAALPVSLPLLCLYIWSLVQLKNSNTIDQRIRNGALCAGLVAVLSGMTMINSYEADVKPKQFLGHCFVAAGTFILAVRGAVVDK